MAQVDVSGEFGALAQSIEGDDLDAVIETCMKSKHYIIAAKLIYL
jgi:hypothetical protein